MRNSPCLIALSEGASADEVACAVQVARQRCDVAKGGELFAILPAKSADAALVSTLPALRLGGVKPELSAQLRDAVLFALRPRMVVGDLPALLAIAALHDRNPRLRAACLIAAKQPRARDRKTLASAFQSLELICSQS